MTLLSRQALHDEINALVEAMTAERLRQVLIALAEEEHPRRRQAFLDRLRQHCTKAQASGIPPSNPQALSTRLDDLKAALERIAESELENAWDWDEEESCGPFQALMPDIFDLLGEAAECLHQGEAQTARDIYSAIWTMVDIENDYGHCPSLEEADDELTREHAACYLRSVLLTTAPDRQVATLLLAAKEVRLSGIVSRPETLYCTLQEIAGVDVTPLPGWEAFLDAIVQELAEPRSVLEGMWHREALEKRQGIDGIARLARQAGARMPRLWVDWVRAAVRQQDMTQAVAAWQEAQPHFPRGASIWRHLADTLQVVTPLQAIPLGDAIAFDALLANPTGHRLLTLYEACRDETARRQRLRAAALWLGEAARVGKPPVSSVESISEGRGRSKPLAEPDNDLVSPTSFECWSPVAVLAWWLVGEGQQARDLVAAEDAVVGWSGGRSPRWALFACLPTVLAGRPASAIGPATQLAWQQLAQSGSWYLAERYLTDVSRDPAEEGVVADRLNEALLTVTSQAPLSSQEARDWLQWCCDTAVERCHAIVSNRHRKAYDRAAACVAVCVETATAVGRAPMAAALVNQLRQQYPRHTAFQRALKERL
ncbi:hypothetical protein [Halomonas sp. NO4]|uniref:hypothetical protein n=1 Tax=Halomonas sp. NO4 TaxID=2484813 RepID=UPI0013D5818B|nr:hypothetical protein [Halomonas sp. NO4]